MNLRTLAGVTFVWLVATAPTTAAVKRYTEYGDINYKIKIGENCDLNFRVSGANLNVQRSVCSAAHFTLAQEMSAFAEVLRAMRRDGHDLREFGMLVIGDLYWTQWHERMADCAFSQFGPNDRKTHDIGIYRKCDVFPELNSVLAPYGIRAEIGSMEETSDIDFLRLGHYDRVVSREWLRKHRKYRGKARVDGLTYLSLRPRR